MANKLDVNLVEHCIGSFGFCRRSSPPPVCTFNILLPWQDTQEDVFGAKQDGVLETSWTCCIFGGKIKVVETGQGAGSADAVLKNEGVIKIMKKEILITKEMLLVWIVRNVEEKNIAKMGL